MKHFVYIVFQLFVAVSIAQLSDDFSDGDFSANPAWTGTTADYIVNTSFELQLNNTIGATSYLATPHGLSNLDNKEWRFWTKQSFSPSGSNFGRVYLTASNADLTSDPDGFYLLFGEALSDDAVRLFKVQSGVHTEILNGPLGQIAASFQMGVRVVRDNAGNWDLYLDATGGENYILAASATDATMLLGSHFGFLEVYTASNANKFFHDRVYVGDEILDVSPPILSLVTPTSATTVDVLFNEAVEQISAETITNYGINSGISVLSALRDGSNPALVHLTINPSLSNGSTYVLSTVGILDYSANNSGVQNINFTYLVAEVPVAGDVVINEFMADPSPPVFLPDAEYIEVYNRSNKVFNLADWKIWDDASSGTIASAWLLPGSYVILATSSTYTMYLNGVSVSSFPSLNNAGDAIVLKSDLGVILDSIYYSDAWYQDPSKADGGYSLERINPESPCTGEQDWKASNDIDGGSPGEVNSVFDSTPDGTPPQLVSLFAMPPNLLQITFNEGMDSSSLALTNPMINPVLTIQSQLVNGTYPLAMQLEFIENLLPSQTYQITLPGVADCWGNTTDLSGTFVLPDVGADGDLVINEILFNPLTGGSDFVELYNRSEKVIDLFNWKLANYDDGGPGNEKIFTDHRLIYPDDYLVLSADSTHLLQTYPSAVSGKFVQFTLPSYNNDSGTVYLLQDNTIRDAVSYTEEWHFALLDDPKGKSLERINPDLGNDKNNWHTAAEAIGFATPGLLNSQYHEAITQGSLNYTSDVISPDNDGFEDVLLVSYELEQNGLVGSFTIYNDRGQKIADVLKSEMLSQTGSFSWDGIRTDGTKASIGVYVGVFEVFSVDGAIVFTKMKAFTVAGKL